MPPLVSSKLDIKCDAEKIISLSGNSVAVMSRMSLSLEKKYWLRRCGIEVLSEVKRKLKMRCFVRVSNTFSQPEWLLVSLFFFCVNIMTFMNESPCLYSQHFHHHVNTRKQEIDRAQKSEITFLRISQVW